MSEKQDRQGVRKASDLEQKYNFGRSFDNLNGAVVAANRAAGNANTAASNANAAASKANTAAGDAKEAANKANTAAGDAKEAANKANTAAGDAKEAANKANAEAEAAQESVEELKELARQVDFVITGTLAEDGLSVELDKSFAEILEAARQKRKCTVVIGGDSLDVFDLVMANEMLLRFQKLTPEGVLVSLEITSDEESNNLQ